MLICIRLRNSYFWCVPSTPRVILSRVLFWSHIIASWIFVSAMAFSRHAYWLDWNPCSLSSTIASRASLLMPFGPVSWIGPFWNRIAVFTCPIRFGAPNEI